MATHVGYPVLTNYTHGGKADSRVWHTKEDNQYYEMVQSMVNKKSVTTRCCYARNSKVKCPAKMVVIPLDPNLILKKQEEGKRARFYVNHAVPLRLDQWQVVENSGTGEHTEFCKTQVEKRFRQYDLNVLNHGTPVERKQEKAK